MAETAKRGFFSREKSNIFLSVGAVIIIDANLKFSFILGIITCPSFQAVLTELLGKIVRCSDDEKQGSPFFNSPTHFSGTVVLYNRACIRNLIKNRTTITASEVFTNLNLLRQFRICGTFHRFECQRFH